MRIRLVVPGATRRLAGPLLCALVLQGCQRLTHVEGPVPGQDVDGIVLHAGNTIVFSDSARVVVREDAVRVREGSRLKRYPTADIDHVLESRFSPARAVMHVAAFVLTSTLLLFVCDDGVEGEFADDEGNYWTQECADDDDDGFDDDEEGDDDD